MFGSALSKNGVKHQTTLYHPQMNGQVEVSNKKIKSILSMTMNGNRIDRSRKLSDSLWAYYVDFKTPIGMSSYQSMFGKAFYLPVDLKHRALWALKKLNFDHDDVINAYLGKHHLMDEQWLRDYESLALYKEKIKR